MKNYLSPDRPERRGDFACCRKAGVTADFDYAPEKAVAGLLLCGGTLKPNFDRKRSQSIKQAVSVATLNYIVSSMEVL